MFLLEAYEENHAIYAYSIDAIWGFNRMNAKLQELELDKQTNRQKAQSSVITSIL